MPVRRGRVGWYSAAYPADLAIHNRPTVYTPAATKAILCCHGHNGDATQYAPAATPGPGLVANTLALAGYQLLSVDHARINSWGDADGMRALDDAYTFLTGTLGISGTKVGLMGWSMGGLTALNWLKRNPAKVACAYLWNPATDIKFWHDAAGAYTPPYPTSGIAQATYTAELDTTFGPSTTATGAFTIPALGGGGISVAVANAKPFTDGYRNSALGLPQATTGGVAFTYTGKDDTHLLGCVSTTASTISVASAQAVTQTYSQARIFHNPYEDVAGFRALGIPIVISQASDDAVVPNGMNRDATNGFVALVNDANLTARVPAPTGGHVNSLPGGGAGAVPDSEVVAFYRANL